MNNSDNISLDSLLERIDKVSSKPKDLPSCSVQEFVSKYSIYKGVDKIPTYVLYYCYNKMKSENIKWGRSAFFRKFKANFELVRHGDQRYYLLNKELLQIPLELIEEAMVEYGKEKKPNKKKRNPRNRVRRRCV